MQSNKVDMINLVVGLAFNCNCQCVLCLIYVRILDLLCTTLKLKICRQITLGARHTELRDITNDKLRDILIIRDIITRTHDLLNSLKVRIKGLLLLQFCQELLDSNCYYILKRQILYCLPRDNREHPRYSIECHSLWNTRYQDRFPVRCELLACYPHWNIVNYGVCATSNISFHFKGLFSIYLYNVDLQYLQRNIVYLKGSQFLFRS